MDGVKGSLTPSAICRYLTAERYALIMQCFSLLLAQNNIKLALKQAPVADLLLYRISGTYSEHFHMNAK